MKKIYLLLSVLLLSSMAWADGAIFHEDFTDQAAFDAWTSTGSDWAWTLGNQTIQGHGLNTGSALVAAGSETGGWLVSQGFTLTAGTTYTISFWGRRGSGANLELYAGTDAGSIATTGTQLAYTPDLGTTGTTQSTYNFTPATSGTYYLGFKAITTDPYIFIDDITVEEAPSCIITEFTFTEGFNTATFPCWTVVKKEGATAAWARNTTTAYVHSGTASIKHNYSSAGGVQSGWLISPQFVLEAGKSYRLKFWSRNQYPGDYTSALGAKNSVLISTAGNDTTSFATEIWSPTSVTDSWVESEIDLSAYNGQSIYIAFHYQGNNSHAWNLDDVSIEEILDYDAGITAVTVANGLAAKNRGLETVSVKIKNFGSQTISTFQLKLEVDGAETIENYTGPAIAGGAESASYALTNQADLSADGDHTIKVTVILPGDGLAANDALPPITVKNTICTPVSIFPWSEGFEGLGVNQLPSDCWSATRLNSYIYINPASPYNGSAPRTGSGYLYFRWNSNDSITTQQFSFTGGQVYKFSFWYIAQIASPGHELYASLHKASDNSFVQLIGTPVTSVTTDYQEYSGLFAPEATGEYYIVVTGKIAYDPTYYVAIDDLRVGEFAAVPDAGVTAITAPVSGVNLSQQAVTVTVRNQGGVELPATTPVAYTLNGGEETVQTIGSAVAVGDFLPVTFTVLADGFVEGDNVIKAYTKLEGDVDLTNDTTSITVFNTVCAASTSISEDFESPLSPCWVIIDGNGDNKTWKRESGTGRTGYSLRYSYSSSGVVGNDWAFSPQVQLEAAKQYKIKFWYKRWNSGYEEKLAFYITPDATIDAATAVPANKLWSQESGMPTAWTLYEETITGYEGAYGFAFQAYSDGNQYHIDIDDFSVEPILDNDLAVTEVTTVASGINLSATAQVSVKIKNLGTQPTSGFAVKFDVDDNVAVGNEIYEGAAIASQAEIIYPFTATADLSAAGDHTIKAYVVFAEDGNVANDTASVTVNNILCDVITSFPLTTDFETELTPCWTNTGSYSTALSKGTQSLRFITDGQSLITPELAITPTDKIVNFSYARRYVNAESFKVGYSLTDTESIVWGDPVDYPESAESEVWKEYTTTVPKEATYIAISYDGENALYIDDLTIDFAQEVVATTPEADATAVAPSQAITLTFAKDIVVADYTLITLKAGETAVDAEANEAGKVLTITPAAALAYNTTYTVTVPAAAINGLSQAYTLTFTTADVPPVIAEDGFIPANGATNVAVGSQVGVTFNKAITLGDISGITINGSTDLITAVARALSNTQLRINHAALAQGTEYTVVIPAGAVVGYEQEITWSFTTIAALVADVKPADGATNVAIDAPLVVGFNRATLAPRGISFAALTIKADGSDESIADITTNWNDTRDTITISHPALEYNTHYTVNIPRGLIIEANDYASEITWSFTTEIEPLVGAWLETFESRTELPAAWTTTLGGIFGTTKYWNLAAAYSRYTAQGKPAIFDDHFVWFDGYANSKNFAANLFTPQFTPTAADHTLTYDVAEALVGDLPSDRNAAGLQLYVEVSTDGGATYIASTDNVLLRYPNHNSETAPDPAAVPYNYTLDLAAYVDQAINVRFRAVSDLGAYVVALDNVGVKTTEVVTGTIVSPEEGAEGVELDEPIIVVFDKSVNTNGAADFSNAVLISENENEIPLVAEISADGTEVVFTHVDLEYASAYTILIPAASVVGLAEDIVSGFSTKLSPLTIESKTPAADATDVELDATIAVTFSRTISLNNVPGVKATVKDADGVAVDGVSLTADGAVLTVNHADLAPATVYTVNIIDVAIAGWFEAITWSFTTKNDVGIHAPQSSVSVYPTISKGNITVAAPVDAKITIVDVLGNALATYHSLGQTPISLNYTNGIYVVVVENKNTVSTHKVILKK